MLSRKDGQQLTYAAVINPSLNYRPIVVSDDKVSAQVLHAVRIEIRLRSPFELGKDFDQYRQSKGWHRVLYHLNDC